MCSLSDWSLASNYGKVAILIFSCWIGLENGGVIAGLASCGVMMNIFSKASDIMQDFKTGYLTLTFTLSMYVNQTVGATMGCVVLPLIFWLFYTTYSVGDPDGSYPAPDTFIYHGIAFLGGEGISSLPKNCLKLALIFFCAAIVINILKELLKSYETKHRIYRFVPGAMYLTISFYLGGFFTVDMCVGSLILIVWRMMNKQSANDLVFAVASGLICSDSLWGIPPIILSFAHVKAPYCNKYFPVSMNHKV